MNMGVISEQTRSLGQLSLSSFVLSWKLHHLLEGLGWDVPLARPSRDKPSQQHWHYKEPTF